MVSLRDLSRQTSSSAGDVDDINWDIAGQLAALGLEPNPLRNVEVEASGDISSHALCDEWSSEEQKQAAYERMLALIGLRPCDIVDVD